MGLAIGVVRVSGKQVRFPAASEAYICVKYFLPASALEKVYFHVQYGILFSRCHLFWITYTSTAFLSQRDI